MNRDEHKNISLNEVSIKFNDVLKAALIRL